MSGPGYRIVAIGVLALLAAFLMAAAGILLARGNDNAPIQIIAPSAGGGGGPGQGNSNAIVSSPTLAPDLRVYVSGAVRNPGVYPLLPGDRLGDAIDTAGGATEDADLTAVNLAQRVHDEGYYYIPQIGETPPPAATSFVQPASPLASEIPGSAGTNNGLIDLNTASLDTLMSLPGIGQVRARAIISYREQNGPFASIEQVMDVQGIGEGTYENIRALVTVGGQ